MDPDTYETYEPYGTNEDKSRVPLKPGIPKSLPHLTDGERTVYETVLHADHPGHCRIEQERIPLTVAHAELERQP